MKKLVFLSILLSIVLSSCVKDEFNTGKEEIAIIGTKWKGVDIIEEPKDTLDITLNFLEDGKLKGYYEPKEWEGTYNFNLETNKGIISDSADVALNFEIIKDTLKLNMVDGDLINFIKNK